MRLNADSREQRVIGWGERPAGELAALADLLVATKKEQTWQELALCAETDPEAFFPEKGGSTKDAKRTCLACDVKDQCLKYALDNDERFGIWGGLSERERRKMKKRNLGGTPLPASLRDKIEALIVEGLSDREVAEGSGIDSRTVGRYRRMYCTSSTDGAAA